MSPCGDLSNDIIAAEMRFIVVGLPSFWQSNTSFAKNVGLTIELLANLAFFTSFLITTI